MRATACAAALLVPAAAAADGAWSTFLTPRTVTDLVVDADTVWAATVEGGLQRYVRSTGTFAPINREPAGLASNRLTALAFDRSRRLWAGTQGEGVSVLSADRSRWSLLSGFDGLPSDTVTVLTVEGDTLWIGTPRGIALWNGREIVGTLPDAVNPSPFASDYVTGLARLGDSLWVTTLAGVYVSRVSTGLAAWSAANGGLPASPAAAPIVTDGTDVFTFVSGDGFYRNFGAGWVREGGIGGPRGIVESRGTILAHSTSGIFRWNVLGWEQVAGSPISRNTPESHVRPAVDPGGRVFGWNQDGLYEHLGAATWARHVPPAPPGNDVVNLAVQGSALYVTTFSEGVGRLRDGAWKLWPPGPCAAGGCDTTFLNSAFTFALLVDPQGLKWFGSWGSASQPEATGAIEILDDRMAPPAVTHVTEWPELARVRHTFAVAATADSIGGRWLGMTSPEDEPEFAPIGIDRYDENGDFVANYRESEGLASGTVRALLTDDRGKVWVGTARGLQSFVWPPLMLGGPPVFEPGTPANLEVRGLAVRRDSLWVLTSDALRLFATTSGNERAAYGIPDGPAPNACRPIAIGKDGRVWVGTLGGVRVHRPDGSLSAAFTTANSPLASDEVQAIDVDPATGVVWIGTAGGLHRYDPAWTPPAPPVLDRLAVRVFPNPLRLTAIGGSVRLTGNASRYRGEILDLAGRRMHRFDIPDGGVLWDGRDGEGRHAGPGIYFVRVEAGGRTGTIRLALVR